MDLLYAAHVPAGEGPFPTVIALHGWGASAHDLLGLAPVLAGGEALVLCPQGPFAFEIARGIPGFGWYPLSEGLSHDSAEIAKAVDALAGFVEAADRRYPVDPRKRVLMGFSQGGVVATALALRDPARVAGLIALSTWLPDELMTQVSRQPEHESLSTLLVHGSTDSMVPVAAAQEARDALLELGVPVSYREYEMGHEIAPEALRDLVAWLDDKVLTPIVLA